MSSKLICLRSCLLVILVAFMANSSIAQKKITGKVTAQEDGRPLSDVSVQVKGKNIATKTSDLGTFTIMADDKDVLVFTSVGFITKETASMGKSPMEISLVGYSQNMSEVIVVGYGTQKKKEFSGAATTLNPLATKFTPSSNVGTALQGSVPGLLVQQTTGAPGSTPIITFRGGTGFDGSGTPLVILDGVFVPSLYGINVNDVESIDVLKDAASTAIYGARAANGVIIVSTKKGKKGRTQVEYTYKHTSNTMRKIGDQYLTGEEYLKMNRLGIRARYLLDSLDGNVTNMNADKGQLNSNWGWAFGSTFGNPAAGLYTTQKVGSTNRQFLTNPAWRVFIDANPFFPGQMDTILYKDISAIMRENMIIQNLPTVEHGVNFSGANDQGAFSLSLNSMKDNGTIIGSNLKRLSMNFNGGLNVGDKLKLKLNTSAYAVNQTVPYTDPGTGASTSQGTGGLLQRFLGVAPTVRYYNDTSGVMLPGPNDVTLGNPDYWSTLYINNSNEQRFTGSLNAEYNIFPNLKFIASGSGFMRYGNSNNFTKSYITGNGGATNTTRAASFSNYNDIQYSYNGFLQYDKSLNKHKLTAMVGGEFTDYKRYVFSGSGQGAPTDLVPWLVASQTPTILNGSLAYPGSASSDFVYWERISSAIGRFNYSYSNKYYLTGILRLDGSSRLSNKNFYGYFPGISAGWNIHNEKFYQNLKIDNIISTLRPRLSYGENGNLFNFGSSYFPTAQVYSNAGVYNGLGGTYAPSYINPNVRWERTNSSNFGLDLGLFNNTINIAADYFVRNVFDKLATLPISAQTGFTGYTTNLSQLQNKGLELTVDAKIIKPKKLDDLSLDAGFTFYTVKNYAIKLPYNGLPGNRQSTTQVWDPKNPGQLMQAGGLVEGRRVGLDEIWAPKWAGIYTSQTTLTTDANVYNAFLPTGNKKVKQLGDAQWYQVNKNDTIDSRQFVYVGRITPVASGNFFVNAGFKGFHLYGAFDYAYGFVILNNEKLRGLSQVQGSQSGTKDILNTWTPNNPNATLPIFYWANQGRNFATDASGNNPPANMWEKGDYMMMRELTLSYSFTQHLMNTVFKNKISKINLYVTGSNLAYFTRYSGILPETGGFDNGRYPLPRRVTLGAQFTF